MILFTAEAAISSGVIPRLLVVCTSTPPTFAFTSTSNKAYPLAISYLSSSLAPYPSPSFLSAAKAMSNLC